MRHRRQVFRVMRRGLYVHPGRKPCVRSWGYVGNVVHQLRAILDAPAEQVAGKTVYLGDPPINLLDWVNAVSLRLVGKPVRVAPRWCVYGIAMVGELLGRLGIRFPITLSRYRSMTENYVTPMDATIALLGPSPYSMEAGIEETIAWLERYEREEVGRLGRSAAEPQQGVSLEPEEMQNGKCKMENAKVRLTDRFPFCILHFAFCTLHSPFSRGPRLPSPARRRSEKLGLRPSLRRSLIPDPQSPIPLPRSGRERSICSACR